MRPRVHPMRRRAIGLVVALGVVVVAALWYLQAPPRSVEAYRERAADTAETLRSQVQTARLWSREVQGGRATRQAAAVAFREAEEDAEATASEFARYVPPQETEELRTALTSLAHEVTDALAELRFVAERGEWEQLEQQSVPLEPLAQRLERLAARASP